MENMNLLISIHACPSLSFPILRYDLCISMHTHAYLSCPSVPIHSHSYFPYPSISDHMHPCPSISVHSDSYFSISVQIHMQIHIHVHVHIHIHPCTSIHAHHTFQEPPVGN